jgi:hypothetical protein
MTNDAALVAHLKGLFADPYSADLTDVVVSDTLEVFVLVGAFDAPQPVNDDEYVESLALRCLDFLDDESLDVIRQRWDDEGFWRKWCDDEGEDEE